MEALAREMGLEVVAREAAVMAPEEMAREVGVAKAREVGVAKARGCRATAEAARAAASSRPRRIYIYRAAANKAGRRAPSRPGRYESR